MTAVVLVCGSRFWRDKKAIRRELKKVAAEFVIQGGAPGADSLAKEVASEMGVGVATYHALWERFGRSAGVIRNGWMLRFGSPNLVLAFHSHLSRSKGTKNMVSLARQDRVSVKVVRK